MGRKTMNSLYDFYLVDCSGRSGALKITDARFLRADQVLEWLRLAFHQYCLREEASIAKTIQWSKDQGRDSEKKLLEWLRERTTKKHWFDYQVKCYPVASDGSIKKDHDNMRDEWLSYEGEKEQ